MVELKLGNNIISVSTRIHKAGATDSPNNNKRESGSAASGVSYFDYPLLLSPTFIDIMDVYKRNHVIKTGVDTLAEASVGNGGKWSVKDESYRNILEAAEDYSELINQDAFHQTVATELWAAGNTIWERVGDNLWHVPIGSIQQILLNKDGTAVEQYKQILPNGNGYKDLTKIQRYMHWRWNTVHNDLIGEGLIAVLLRRGRGYLWKDSNNVTHQSARPAMIECIEEMDDSLRKGIRKLAPRTNIILEGFTNGERQATASTINTLAPEDNLVMNTEQKDKQNIRIEQTQFDNRSRLDPIIDHFFNTQVIAMQTPTIQLLMDGGYTEASSRTAIQAVDRKIRAFCRQIKRQDEQQLFYPYLRTQGFTDEELRQSRLRWNWAPVEKPTVSIGDVVQLLQVQQTMMMSDPSLPPFLPPQAVAKLLVEAGLPIELDGQKQSQQFKPNPPPAPVVNTINKQTPEAPQNGQSVRTDSEKGIQQNKR